MSDNTSTYAWNWGSLADPTNDERFFSQTPRTYWQRAEALGWTQKQQVYFQLLVSFRMPSSPFPFVSHATMAKLLSMTDRHDLKRRVFEPLLDDGALRIVACPCPPALRRHHAADSLHLDLEPGLEMLRKVDLRAQDKGYKDEPARTMPSLPAPEPEYVPVTGSILYDAWSALCDLARGPYYDLVVALQERLDAGDVDLAKQVLAVEAGVPKIPGPVNGRPMIDQEAVNAALVRAFAPEAPPQLQRQRHALRVLPPGFGRPRYDHPEPDWPPGDDVDAAAFYEEAEQALEDELTTASGSSTPG